MEIWKTIVPIKKKGGGVFTPYGYEISNFGRVRTKRQRYGKPRKSTGKRQDLAEYRYISGRPDAAGYIQLCLHSEDKLKSNIRVHVAVMQTFVGYPEEGQVVCHYDDIKTNNHLTNLRYDTQKANIADRIRNKKLSLVS